MASQPAGPGTVADLAPAAGGVLAADRGAAAVFLAGERGRGATVAVAEGEPAGVAAGPGGTFWVADAVQARVLRVVGGPPRRTRFLSFDGYVARAVVGLETGGWDTTVTVDVVTTRLALVVAAPGARTRTITLRTRRGTQPVLRTRD